MTQIEKLQHNLQNCRDMITYKGGNVGDTTGFNHLAKEIETIPAGNADYVYVEDNTVAYKKQIMAGALPKAKLKELGGMTYKCNNLIPFPYYNGQKGPGYTEEVNGITFLVNEDGSITANGTATANATFLLDVTSKLTSKNISYTISGGSDGVNVYIAAYNNNSYVTEASSNVWGSTTFNWSEIEYTRNTLFIIVPSGTTTSNLVCKPMLNYGTNALPFEKYYEGLRDVKPTAIRRSGANLTDETTVDPSVQINPEVYRELPLLMGKGTYTISFSTKIYWQSHSTNVTRITGTTNANVFVFSINDDEPAYVRFRDNTSSSTPWDYNTTIMVNVGSTAFPYTPYRADVEIPLPEEITSWSEWGKGFGTYCNTYDSENGKYIQRVGVAIFDGSDDEEWKQYGDCLVAYDAVSKLPGCLSFVYAKTDQYVISNYGTNNSDKSNDTSGGVAVYTEAASGWIVLHESINVADVKTTLGNKPLVISYALAEPIITDGPIYPNTLDVEGGAVIEFANDYNQPVPSTITYLRRTV